MNSSKCMRVFLNLHEKQIFLGFSTLAFTSKTLTGHQFSVFWAESLKQEQSTLSRDSGTRSSQLRSSSSPASRHLEQQSVSRSHCHVALPAGINVFP